MSGISFYLKRSRPRVFLRKPHRRAIYYSGPPQDSRLFSKKPRGLPLRRSSGTWAAISVPQSPLQVAALERLWFLVKVGSRTVQIATPAFQPTPVCHEPTAGHQVSYQRFWENRWTPDSLSQIHPRLVANLLTLIPTVIPRCPAQGRTSIKSGTRPLCLSTKATEDDHLIPTAHSQRD